MKVVVSYYDYDINDLVRTRVDLFEVHKIIASKDTGPITVECSKVIREAQIARVFFQTLGHNCGFIHGGWIVDNCSTAYGFVIKP